MDKNDVRKHRADFERALGVGLVGTRLTGEVAPRATYDSVSGTITFKVTITVPGAKGKVETDWERYAEAFGADPTWLGKTFADHNDVNYTVVGLNPRAKSYPLLIEDANGKRRKCAASYVQAAMDVQEEAS
ncbi:MAG: hypothetical protein WBG86_20635 [Polyangiales bacterium]